MAVLRELSIERQVLVSTHSPFVLNELQGHEVTVVVRDGEYGTRGTLLQDTSGYEKRSKVYSLRRALDELRQRARTRRPSSKERPSLSASARFARSPADHMHWLFVHVPPSQAVSQFPQCSVLVVRSVSQPFPGFPSQSPKSSSQAPVAQ